MKLTCLLLASLVAFCYCVYVCITHGDGIALAAAVGSISAIAAYGLGHTRGVTKTTARLLGSPQPSTILAQLQEIPKPRAPRDRDHGE